MTIAICKANDRTVYVQGTVPLFESFIQTFRILTIFSSFVNSTTKESLVFADLASLFSVSLGHVCHLSFLFLYILRNFTSKSSQLYQNLLKFHFHVKFLGSVIFEIAQNKTFLIRVKFGIYESMEFSLTTILIPFYPFFLYFL